MRFSDVSVPEVYKESQDFRFFLDWIAKCFTKSKFDIENISDLYDPLRCPEWLLWMLGDTMGFKYDDRLPTAFNRLVLVYFMSMIRNKGSKDGVTLAAEVNLAQFNLAEIGKENPTIMYNRLEDTSIPVNSVYVTAHTADGYIDVVYFSTEKPIDACIEYVRPLGMYLFQYAGVRIDSKTKVSVDARLTNTRDLGISIGATHVGHYSRQDYARMQKMYNEKTHEINTEDLREDVWYRNSYYEENRDPDIDPGWRAIYSLQLCNNEQIVKSLLDPIFSIGFGPQDVTTVYPDNYLDDIYSDTPLWNLRYDREMEESITGDVYTLEDDRTESIIHPRPAVNPIKQRIGDKISLNAHNTKYIVANEDGSFEIKKSENI